MVSANNNTTTSTSISLRDHATGVCYQVDSGAEVSVVHISSRDRRTRPQGCPFRAANGSRISTFGSLTRCLNLGGLRTSHSFIRADVP